ncbi:Glutamine-dependent NAD(+) synthetase [Posidoniimonas corsicana]|uniref:Glutamine-dependent NAD(+) synthetase n=1 Tax=Posidoniimonas corsicana TaxID=1938618 RepID=A0A5C5VDG9_9BACT|nr:NAD(+) synthase [Posidoniimonas corsicana]TWT35997.1 Glutamine-dependent NAD(+) synthetase [Posidoniimonas corsicana]
MRLVRVAAAALNQTPLDWDANARNIRRAISSAREADARLLCLPELCITGYGCEDAFYSRGVLRMAERVLAELLSSTEGMAVSVGLPIQHAGALFNATALLVDGAIAGLVAKQHLAGDGLHYEPRWFKPWPDDAVTSIRLAGSELPIGDLLFDIDGVRLGFEICEDAWVANRPGLDHAKLSADILFNPSASHFAFGKSVTRRRLVEEASRSLAVTYVYSNLVGNEAGRVIYDGQTIIATCGETVACGPRLGFESVSVMVATVDVDAPRMRRAQSASFEPQVVVDNARSTPVAFKLPAAKPTGEEAQVADWEKSKHLKEEEFTRAVTLGLHDYARKSRSHGFVVSLSGGADSAAVVCLVRMTVQRAIDELGIAAACEAFGHGPENDLDTLTAAVLTTVYQATRNSSLTTRDAAREIALAIGATRIELDVDDVCDSYTRKTEAALGRELTWESDDIALQNIQARSRAPSVWMLANVKNALLLATSNRSEAAVGYATMDGDTCGGLSPIAGIDKAFLRQWLGWLEGEGPDGLGSIPELSVVNRQQPTAELRPQDAGQTDEDDLMPYDLLDAIEDHAIGEKRSPAETLSAVSAQFSGYEPGRLTAWVRRFFELWSRNQWKRERYAPSFHVDDKNLDPKTWCRFPILSGWFRRELNELQDADSHDGHGS